MPKRVNLPSGGRLAELDLVSYGRRGRHTPLRPQSKPLPIAGTQPQGDAIHLLRFAVPIVTSFVNWIALQNRIDEQPQELRFR